MQRRVQPNAVRARCPGWDQLWCNGKSPGQAPNTSIQNPLLPLSASVTLDRQCDCLGLSFLICKTELAPNPGRWCFRLLIHTVRGKYQLLCSFPSPNPDQLWAVLGFRALASAWSSGPRDPSAQWPVPALAPAWSWL